MAMLALQTPSSSGGRGTTPHIVPFRVNHTGPASISDRYWDAQPASETTNDASNCQVAYFRGRRLMGRRIPLQEGYRGTVVKMTDIAIAQGSGPSTSALEEREEDDEADDDEECFEPTRAMEELASFDAVMVWDHEALPKDEDPSVRGLQEWIGLAEGIHGYDEDRNQTAKSA